MHVLALDLSRKRTGIAFGAKERPMTSSLPLPEVEGSDAEGWSYGPAWAKLFRFMDEHRKVVGRPDLIIYEAPLPAQAQKHPVVARTLMGLATVVETYAELFGIDCEECHNQTLKKFWTGHGHADEHEMMAVCEMLNWPVKNHDECDAAALWAKGRGGIDPAYAAWISAKITPLFGRRPEPA